MWNGSQQQRPGGCRPPQWQQGQNSWQQGQGKGGSWTQGQQAQNWQQGQQAPSWQKGQQAQGSWQQGTRPPVAGVRPPTPRGGAPAAQVRPAGAQAAQVRPASAQAGPGPVVRPPAQAAGKGGGRQGLISGLVNGQAGNKRPAEAPAAAQANKAAKVTGSTAGGAEWSEWSEWSLDDDDEILQEEEGEATLAKLVADWDGTVLSIADIAARNSDATIAKLVGDAEAIARAHFHEDWISQIVRDSGYRLTMLVEDSTTVTGFLVYSYKASCIEVIQTAIAEAHRGRGLGRCAMTWLLEHAKKAGLDSITVGCTAEGVQFYERCGFKHGSRTPDGRITMCLDVMRTETVTPVKKEQEAAQTPAGQEKGGKGQAGKGKVPVAPKGQAAPKAVLKPAAANLQGPKAVLKPAVAKPGVGGVVPPKVGAKGGPAKAAGLVPPKEAGQGPVVAGRIPAPKVEPAKAKGQTVAPKGQTVAPPKTKGVTVKPKAKQATEEVKEKMPEITMSRGTVIMKIFDACDADGDRLLNENEMLTFAKMGGFQGDERQWTTDWRALCTKQTVNFSQGLDMVRFEKVINEGSCGQYTDEELHLIFHKLLSEANYKAAKAERRELIKVVFEACDVDKDEALSAQEMKRVVLHIGFSGSHEEWLQEYSDMCLEHKRDPALGINFELFEKLVSDSTESGCYCSNKDLEAVLENRAALEAEKGPKTVKPPPKRAGPNSRESISGGLFKALDVDNDGYLNMKEMQAFANLIGFHCDDEKWAKEFGLFCEQGEADPAVGVDEKLFKKLVDDRSDAGCYCSDGELKDMLKELNPNAGEISSRGALILAVFKACDQDSDEKLNTIEMRDFAGYTGFDGDEEAWKKEYTMLCAETASNPDDGIDLKSFTKLVNDTSERGCYCRDVELAQMVRQMNASNFLGGGEGGGGGDVSTRISLTPVSRSAIIRTIFHLCDKDGNKLLDETEMRGFATTAGFDGSEQEWAKEYRFVCMRIKTNPAKGVNPAMFIQVINNGSAGRYTDQELKNILEKLELQKALDSGASGRSSIIRAVFHACDLDSDGYLNRQEMKHIANHVGFKGSAEEWAKEYLGMCVDHGADPQLGIDLAVLEALVEDSSESGCFCSDRDLRAILQSMGETDGGDIVKVGSEKDSARAELIRNVFKQCDLDRDGLLDEQEMRAFAFHVGFDGSNDEWSREFSLLCREKNSHGIDLLLFEKLVNDSSENGCHCTDPQLQMILTKLDLGFR